MEKIKCLILLTFLIGAVQCDCNNDAAYLTQYIEKNDLYTGKLKALVTSSDLTAKGVLSFSGYLTVNKACESNIYFWFFPAQTKSASAPVVIWLQGGPGASSMYGMLMENGPVLVNDKNGLDARKYTWTKDHNVLYIDNPVGARFSYTTNTSCYARNKDDVEVNLFEAVRQFFMLFKELRTNPLYLTGESYAGKYVPILGHAINKYKNSADPSYRLNLQGVSIGNGVTDPVNQIVFGNYFYQLEYIKPAERDQFNSIQNLEINYINQGLIDLTIIETLYYTFGLINTKNCLFNNLTGFEYAYNFLRYEGYNPSVDRAGAYLSNPDGIKKCLNVGTRLFAPFSETNPVLGALQNDILTSVAPYLAELVQHYKVVIYTGQLDLLVNVVGTEKYLSLLEHSAKAEFNSAKRNKWIVNNHIAGWFKKAGNLTYVIVHNAGHMVPVDQPEAAYDLLRHRIINRISNKNCMQNFGS